jgi:hypothetical protein
VDHRHYRATGSQAVKYAFALSPQNIRMETNDQRYLVQQNKLSDTDNTAPVFAKVMRSKEGKFEGVSFIRNKEKATVMTIADAQEVIQWAAKKKDKAGDYATKIICVGQ